jgi:hypothetical protein
MQKFLHGLPVHLLLQLYSRYRILKHRVRRSALFSQQPVSLQLLFLFIPLHRVKDGQRLNKVLRYLLVDLSKWSLNNLELKRREFLGHF